MASGTEHIISSDEVIAGVEKYGLVGKTETADSYLDHNWRALIRMLDREDPSYKNQVNLSLIHELFHKFAFLKYCCVDCSSFLYKAMNCKNYLAELSNQTRYFPRIPQIDKP